MWLLCTLFNRRSASLLEGLEASPAFQEHERLFAAMMALNASEAEAAVQPAPRGEHEVPATASARQGVALRPVIDDPDAQAAK